jgi:aminopeptidase N
MRAFGRNTGRPPVNERSIRASAALLLLSGAVTACGKPPPAVEPGVSLVLAQQRAETISGINYQLSLTIPDSPGEAIDGRVVVTFELSNASQPLQLDFRESADKIRSVAANGDESDYRFVDEHVVVPAQELVTGHNEIRIDFIAGSSSLNRNPEFLYSLFVPDRARTAFPLFDQPNLKATFELDLTIPAGWAAMANAPLVDVRETENGILHRFARSDLISSYLFSFVAGRFESVSRTVGGRQMTLLHRETDEEKFERNVDEILSLHANALDWLEEYTGIDYPYEKFGFALIPDFPYGGMEHVGAIQYRASNLLLDEAPSDTRLLSRASLIAHETAHMWFGNLVTMEWFNDVWTKEVFANFMAAKIVNPQFPDINHDLNFLVRHYPSAYSVDRTAGANAIRQELPNLNEAGQMYGAIIYNKAPIMMRKLEKLIGEAAFREGVREYLETFAFGNATWPALVEILDGESAEDLRAWSEAWVHTPGREAVESQWGTSAEGEGGPFRYGLVPAAISDLRSADEVVRAATLINLYEGLLAQAGPGAPGYLRELASLVRHEDNDLLLELALNQMRTIYWTLLRPGIRDDFAPLLEQTLWETMLGHDGASKRKVLFEAFADIALTQDGLARARDVWSGSMPVDELPLAENDRISIAQSLAVRLPDEAQAIVDLQVASTKNPDNLRKLRFIEPSLSADPAVRDAFFASLADEANRSTESWVLEALANLHHPVRSEASERYLLPSLELLQEIQVTGDIFFPKRWLDATLRNYHSTSAVTTVRTFLVERPAYNAQLRMKILQAADMLFRANAIVASQEAP